MIDIHSDEYWKEEFTVTVADLDRFFARIQQDNKAFDLTSLVKQLVEGRLKFGHEVSPTVLKSWTGKESVRIWDPFVKWSFGDGIIVPRDVVGDGNDEDYECFIGEVISVDRIRPFHIEIRLDGHDKPVPYRYGNQDAIDVGQFSKDLVEKKYGEVERIVAHFGNRIVSALLHALESDERFTGLEGEWYLVHKLPIIELSIFKSMHQTLLQKTSFTLNDLLPMVQIDGLQNEILQKMAIQVVLQQLPERFENIGTLARPLWRARLPEPDQAQVTHYAYDPQTYEILCYPGQRLNKENAERLQELDIYGHVVIFA